MSAKHSCRIISRLPEQERIPGCETFSLVCMEGSDVAATTLRRDQTSRRNGMRAIHTPCVDVTHIACVLRKVASTTLCCVFGPGDTDCTATTSLRTVGINVPTPCVLPPAPVLPTRQGHSPQETLYSPALHHRLTSHAMQDRHVHENDKH